jgi:hypothetical protein
VRTKITGLSSGMAMGRARVRVLDVSRIRRRGFVDARTRTGSLFLVLVVASKVGDFLGEREDANLDLGYLEEYDLGGYVGKL